MRAERHSSRVEMGETNSGFSLETPEFDRLPDPALAPSEFSAPG
jgi:hypothetical protein